MRLFVPALGLSALALVAFMVPSGPASAAKSKMGCEVGKEVWNATTGKCEAGKSKYKTARKAAKKAAPKAKADTKK